MLLRDTAARRLDSLTTGGTENGVFVAQRACKIVSAHVSFNTKPDAGALDAGTSNTDPDEIADAFDLSTLTDDTPAALTIVARDVAAGARVWAKVGQATSVAGVGGLLTVRYVELP